MAVLSRNTKKTATPISVKTRTARSGWVTCTLAAISCTQIDMVIRCDTFTNSAKNASRPELSVPASLDDMRGLLPCDTAHAAATSVFASQSALGSADSTMDTVSTMPISSASPTWASVAASSNSRATANEIDRVRSPPRDDSASEAVGESPTSLASDLGSLFTSPMAPVAGNEGARAGEREVRALQTCDVGAAANESYQLHRTGHTGTLHLRRLVLSTGGRSRSASGVRKQRPSRAASRLTHSVGAIFGATLKSVLDYAGVSHRKHDVVDTMRHAARFLAPTKDALASATGVDRPHLVNGLMSESVATAQRRRLGECYEAQGARTYLGRNGLSGIAVGATAAVLVTHYLMSTRSDTDAVHVLSSLTDALARVDALLANWAVATNRDDDWHLQALRAEARAVGRVRAVAVAATGAARAQGLDPSTSLHLHFDWMRGAAWPRAARVDASTHVLMCEALAKGGVLDSAPSVALPPLMPPPLRALPLAALPASVWITSAASEAWSSSDGSRSEAGSIASSVSASSVGSEAEEARGLGAGTSGSEESAVALSMFCLG